MRTSAGFWEIGLSGKIRIQIRPPRLIWRVIARRAASIWRAVRRPRPTAFKPNSPKLTFAPRVATPVLRPFCSLRYFLLAGCSILCSSSCLALRFGSGRCHRLLATAQNFALEHPDLDADYAVSRLRFGESVVDVGAQRVKRYAAFAVPLGARNFYPVQASRAHDLDALRAEAHGVLDRALHRATEHDPLFQLLRDRIRNQLGVHFRLAHLLDIDMDRHAHQFLQLSSQIFDVLALLADDHARTRAIHRDLGILGRTLDDDLADRGMCQLLLQEVADLDVLMQHGREILAVRIPACSPVAVHREPESYRVNFLSHAYSLSPTVR